MRRLPASKFSMCQSASTVTKMNNFFCPILETLCPLFEHFAQMGSGVPRWGLFLPTFKFRPCWQCVMRSRCQKFSRSGQKLNYSYREGHPRDLTRHADPRPSHAATFAHLHQRICAANFFSIAFTPLPSCRLIQAVQSVLMHL